MVANRVSLTVYRVRDEIDGKRVKSPDDAVQIDENTTSRELPRVGDFEAKLFIAPPPTARPSWAEFLEQGFGSIHEIEANVANRAVLVVKVKYAGRDCYFAFPFGTGRFLLKSGSYVWNYGLRVALNTVYRKGEEAGGGGRIRSIDAKTVAATTFYTRRQASRWADFETFDVDIQRDLLKAVTGRPAETGEWGTRIDGGDAAHLSLPVDFAGLGRLCKRIERTYQRKDYRDRFSWIDKIHTVKEREIIDDLQQRIIEKLRRRDVSKLDLAPPELVDWDEIDVFRFSIEPQGRHIDLDIRDYLDALEESGALDSLAFEDIRQVHRVEVLDLSGSVKFDWPVLRCLTGELSVGGKSYLVDGCDLFEVAGDYAKELEGYIKDIPEAVLPLPDSKEDTGEGDYNTGLAEGSDVYLLLDKNTVRLSTHTTPIEICDILTKDHSFIHIKRDLGSSCLSHLFAQGLVSADLFLMNREFRKRTKEIITALEKKLKCQGRFSSFSVEGINPSEYEVVYAIIAKWNGKRLAEALPFFSKVNLRRQVQDLKRMGYRVSCKRVMIV